MKLSIIADEISKDPHAAVHIGTKQLDIHQYELRFIMNCRVPDITSEQAEELLWIKERYDISYSAIAAGLFKCLPDQAALDKQMERMERAIKLAKKLGAKTVTGFALHDVERYRTEEFKEIIVPYLQETCRQAAAEGLTFAVETEYMTGCETAKDARELVGRVGQHLKVNWDPANCWVAGEHPLEGYVQVKGLIANMHVKDADTRDWRSRNPFVGFGEGLVPWPRLLPILYRDQTVERLTVETHIQPHITKTEKGVARLRSILNELYRMPVA
ncbi:MAG: Sugar phosphate isomerase/epimerase [Paenibacillus sp.]|jgi:sugar phosphate isomerase/epimerase|nr:Sugar phosphate isomerase/epimerase [Paenibacillus sp.]